MLGVGCTIFEEIVERLEKNPGACSRANAIPFIEAVLYHLLKMGLPNSPSVEKFHTVLPAFTFHLPQNGAFFG